MTEAVLEVKADEFGSVLVWIAPKIQRPRRK
jgi:hypothetical protein